MAAVFISFAHDDNLPLDGRVGKESRGWVDIFEWHLNSKLRERGQKQVQIWRDPQLKPGADWDETILDKVCQAEVLVPVVSPPFVNSAYCWKSQGLLGSGERRDRLRPKIVLLLSGHQAASGPGQS
jgi:hypothetical protein